MIEETFLTSLIEGVTLVSAVVIICWMMFRFMGKTINSSHRDVEKALELTQSALSNFGDVVKALEQMGDRVEKALLKSTDAIVALIKEEEAQRTLLIEVKAGQQTNHEAVTKELSELQRLMSKELDAVRKHYENDGA